MKFPEFDHYVTGTAIPVSALRTRESCGIGEFLDLIPFAGFCTKCGIEVVQILPINDTGSQISPYSAVSAFALHPVYIRLQNLPGSGRFHEQINALKKRYAGNERLAFEEVLEEKLKLCREIYGAEIDGIEKNRDFNRWIEDNPWVASYSVYKCLKLKNNKRSWTEWTQLGNPSEKDIDDYWNANGEETQFFAWLQYHLERQLREAAETLGSIPVALKGDLPILMSEDSADVWMNRRYFQLNIRAGAPPDMFSDEGQNWGFPIYNWERLEQDDFNWWKRRLRQAAKIYHAFRIDHVLGFFRIWGVPDYEDSASMGYYVPYNYIPYTALEASGFPAERITWLSKAHVFQHEIEDVEESDRETVAGYLNRIGDEDLFRFNNSIRGGADIEALPVSNKTKQILKNWKKNRTLIEVDENLYTNTWHFARSRGWESLDNHERRELQQIIDKAGSSSEKTWEKEGRKILKTLRNETDMLVCAEDLGVIPSCVPKVLRELHLLSLKISFWTRRYHEPEEPFVPVREYPFESVATLSVHDSFVFREWWENASDEKERTGFCEALGIEDISKHPYTPETAEIIIEAFFSSAAYLAILQIQDFFALDSSLRRDVELERINTPGTVLEKNWRYRLPATIEELQQNDNICSAIRKAVTVRSSRKIPKENRG